MEVGNIFVRLGADISGFERNMSAAEKAMIKVGDKFQDIGRKVAIAGAAITASMGAAVITTANYGDTLYDLAQRTGVAVETLSGLKLAADKSGSSLDGLAVGLRGLANAMQSAASGSKEAGATFNALGVQVTNADGTLRNMKDVMFDVADRFAAMEDGATKTALANDLFGRSGMALIPMLNLGSAGLKAEWEQAEKLGIVMTTKAAAGCDQFNDRLTELKASVQGAAIQLGNALLPTVESVIVKITNVITKVKEWAAAHPELTSVIGTATLAVGGFLTVLGPVLISLGTILKLLPTVASALGATTGALLASTAAFTAGAAALAVYIAKLMELSAAEDKAIAAGGALAETENRVIDKLSEAAVAADWQYGRMSKLIQAYHGNIAALETAIKRGKEGVDIQNALAEVGKKHALAIEEQKQKMAAADPVARALQQALNQTRQTTIELAGGLNDVLIPAVDATRLKLIDLSQINSGLSGGFGAWATEAVNAALSIVPPLVLLESKFKVIGDALGVSAATVKVEMWNMAADVLAAFGIIVAKMPEVATASNIATEQIKSYWQEVSTIIADAARNIASSIVGMFDIQGLFGAGTQTPKFDSSYYDQMIAAITDAYEKERTLIERSNDAKIDAARRAYSAQELLINREQEDYDRALQRKYDAQDLAYERQYEAQKRAIQNSALSEKEKQERLLALQTKYEDARIAREQKREDAKVARDRRREDARLKRELAQEKKLEAIREAGLNKLLALQWQHETDMQAIRDAETAAREKQAKDEEDRQKSLWFKVKGIFANIVEEMATLWISRFIMKLLPGIESIGTALTSKVGGILGTLSQTAGSMASGLLSSLGSIGSIITGITSVISLLKGPQKQTDVTYWLKLQWELLQNSYNFLVGKLTWMLESIPSGVRYLSSIKDASFKISTATQLTKDRLQSVIGGLKTCANYLRSIDIGISKLPHAASGGVFTQPTLAHIAEREPEIVMPLRDYRAEAVQTAGRSGPVVVNIRPVVIDKKDRYLIEFIQEGFDHNVFRIPTASVGG